MFFYYKIRNKLVCYIMLSAKLWWFVVHFFRNTLLISVIGIIRDNPNKILILKHTYRPNPWHLPSGWMQRGETPLSTIIR